MSEVLTPLPGPVKTRLETPTSLARPRFAHGATTLPHLPAAGRRSRIGLWSFLLMVVLPTLAGIAYFNAFAARQYVTTAVFALRVGEERDDGAGAGGSLVGAFGPPAGGPAVTQSYGLARYIASGPAIEDITHAGTDVRGILSNPMADGWARLPEGASRESLMRRWRAMVSANFEVTSGVMTLRTHAFTPEDSLALARGVITASEGMVNGISERMHGDALHHAEAEVKAAAEVVNSARGRLQNFRTQSGVLDPARATALNSDAQARMRQELLMAEGQADSLRAASGGQAIAVNSALATRIRTMRQQLEEMERQVSRNTNDRSGSAWASLMEQHDALNAELRIADTRYAQAVEGLQRARTNAVRQSTYVLPFVRPVLATEANWPHPLLSPLILAGCALLTWAITLLVFYAVRDHA